MEMNGDMAYPPGIGLRFLEITDFLTKVSLASRFLDENCVRPALLCSKKTQATMKRMKK